MILLMCCWILFASILLGILLLLLLLAVCGPLTAVAPPAAEPVGHAGPAAMAHGPSRSAARGILLDRGTNPCPLHWQADSQPLCHQGSPFNRSLLEYNCFTILLVSVVQQSESPICIHIPISPPSCISLPHSLSHTSRWSQSTQLISLCYAAASH